MSGKTEIDNATARRAALIWGGLAAVLVLAAVGLWARHGTELFLDMLVAGWTACFG